MQTATLDLDETLAIIRAGTNEDRAEEFTDALVDLVEVYGRLITTGDFLTALSVVLGVRCSDMSDGAYASIMPAFLRLVGEMRHAAQSLDTASVQ